MAELNNIQSVDVMDILTTSTNEKDLWIRQAQSILKEQELSACSFRPQISAHTEMLSQRKAADAQDRETVSDLKSLESAVHAGLARNAR